MSHNRLIHSAIQTPDGTIIESRHRHDYKTYEDANGKTYMIDGGIDYIRCSINGDEKFILSCLEDGIEAYRKLVTWGTYGPNGDQPIHYKKLAEMDDDHIEAILETQTRIHPHMKVALQEELKYRQGSNINQISDINCEDKKDV